MWFILFRVLSLSLFRLRKLNNKTRKEKKKKHFHVLNFLYPASLSPAVLKSQRSVTGRKSSEHPKPVNIPKNDSAMKNAKMDGLFLFTAGLVFFPLSHVLCTYFQKFIFTHLAYVDRFSISTR